MKPSSSLPLLFLIGFTDAWISSRSRATVFSGLHLSLSDETATAAVSSPSVEDLKSQLLTACTASSSPDATNIRQLVTDLMAAGEMAGQGQASSSSGFLSGDWELVYGTEDDTRSSPFFWAFRQAFPASADQIYSITDSIPAPLKEVGPARQSVEWVDSSQTGRFVSRVKVATLGGAATSIMTTRASMIGTDGVDGVVLEIETTKPEKSTAIATLLGPLGNVVNENAPAFPSGAALEQAQPGSSKVIMRTGYCDEGLRISWDDKRPDYFFVWRRSAFADYDFL